jgi:two-component system chemotaxis response regulator CheB
MGDGGGQADAWVQERAVEQAEKFAVLRARGQALVRGTADLAGRIARTEGEVMRVHEDIAQAGVSSVASDALQHAERARRFAEHERRQQQRWSSVADRLDLSGAAAGPADQDRMRSSRVHPTASSRPTRFPVVALVCSVGGAEALIRVLRPLPADLPAAIVALQHLDPHHSSALTARLAAVTSLSVRTAVEGARLQPGVVDVAPPGQHLLLTHEDRLLMVHSRQQPALPRPSADLLLVSMAAVLGPRLLAVVLTGNGEDGAVGVQVVNRYGGRILVQNQATSRAYAMPAAALDPASLDAPVALDDLAAVIAALIRVAARRHPRGER